jgi:predicted acylesterase/phospholipase RssA
MFEQAVFAGGGHRCWWQAGFWETVREPLELRPRVIAATSAGAATACLLYANSAQHALAYYEPIIAKQRGNVQWSNWNKRGARFLPHEDIYRTALAHLLGGQHYKQLMWNAPEIRVVCARAPVWLPTGAATAVGMLSYALEKRFVKPVHPRWGWRLGFRSFTKRVQECVSQQDLIDLLLGSSCTPPFTRQQRVDGKRVLDGGMVDNVPVHAVEPDRSTLVLLSRQYSRHAPVFSRHGRLYVQPSQPIPVTQFDYTDHSKLVATYEMGCHDGRSFLASVQSNKV